MFEYLGLILVVLSWLGGYLLISKFYDKNLPTISKHAASSRTASWLFAAILIVLGAAFYWWIIKWLTPQLELSLAFSVTLTIAILCQFIAALAPDIDGWRGVAHRWSAWSMAVLYLPLSVLHWLYVSCSYGNSKVKIPATAGIVHCFFSAHHSARRLRDITAETIYRYTTTVSK